MAVPDDTRPSSPSGDPRRSEPPPGGSDGGRPLRQRIAARWNGLAPAGKAGVIGGLAVALVKGFFVLSNARASAAGPRPDSGDDDSYAPFEHRHWTNHAGGYYVCRHQGCSKKADWTITAHDCCGRCGPGRNCLRAAQRDYDGPGRFAHRYFETWLRPGVCDVCGELPEAH